MMAPSYILLTGLQVFDHEEWNAWHYGDNAYQKDPITR